MIEHQQVEKQKRQKIQEKRFEKKMFNVRTVIQREQRNKDEDEEEME